MALNLSYSPLELPLISSSQVLNTMPVKEVRNTSRKRKKQLTLLPNIYSSRDVELVRNLSLENVINPMEKMIKYSKDKEEIDRNEDILFKRKGIKRENSEIHLQNLSQIEKEFKSAHSQDFYQKYETILKEKKMEDDILKLRKEINDCKFQKDIMYKEFLHNLQIIDDFKLEIKLIDSEEYYADKKNEVLNNMGENMSTIGTGVKHKKKEKHRQRKMDLFVLQTLNMKEQSIKNEKKNALNEQTLAQIEKTKLKGEEIKKIEEVIANKNKILEKRIENLIDHYHQILYEGLDTRQEGLSWVIKEIWKLGQNVKLSFFPKFLDSISIDYLFTVAHKNVEITQLKTEIDKKKIELQKEFAIIQRKKNEEQNNSNKMSTIFRTSVPLMPLNAKGITFDKFKTHKQNEETKNEIYTLKRVNEMCKQKESVKEVFKSPIITIISKLTNQKEQIERELKQLRKQEMQRLYKECIENDHETKYQASIETIVSALVGETNKDKELVEFAKIRKMYIDNLRNIEYFSVCKKPKTKNTTKLRFASFTNSQ